MFGTKQLKWELEEAKMELHWAKDAKARYLSWFRISREKFIKLKKDFKTIEAERDGLSAYAASLANATGDYVRENRQLSEEIAALRYKLENPSADF